MVLGSNLHVSIEFYAINFLESAMDTCCVRVCVCVEGGGDRQVTVGVGIYGFFLRFLSQGSLVRATLCFLLIHHCVSSCASHTFRALIALKARRSAFIELLRARVCSVQPLR